MAIPQYHLAMSDGSIRNFCSYNCVVSFQVSLVLTKFNCLYLSIFFGKDIYVFFFFFYTSLDGVEYCILFVS